ncbi:MAG TPA: 2-amino-4-hydroxy-6-hydroxymethyldihydropteridine diphosphokinase [Candidatus Eremiobacteraceae bacterium]|nr:2-amino-4-hydroxy-6-hydroxymethyldihydropteridine diphosphokinase [Candidatus Eremiobacteraceae bacterium]
MTPHRAFIGIGSNLDDSAGYVREGFAALAALGRVTAVSDLYLTRPWGKTDQPSFVNAVAEIETDRSAPALIAELLELERDMGRVRGERYGPRTIDFDLLLYDSLRSSDPGCSVPHPELARRAFALAPLAQIAAGVTVPGADATVGELLAALPDEERAGVRRLAGTAHPAPAPRLDYDAPAGAGAGYADLRPFSGFDRAVLEAALRALGDIAGRRVLDIGCGTGRFTRELAARGAFVTGMDSSETMLAQAMSHAAPADRRAPEYVLGDANLALPGAEYDAVTAFYAVQYLEIGAVFRRVKRVLRGGGVLALATFPHRHFVESVFARYFPSMAAIDLARFPSQQHVQAELLSAGFEDVRTAAIVMELRDPPGPLLERVEKKYLSSFHLLGEREFSDGVAAMRSDWHGLKEVIRSARSIVVSGRAP